MDVTDGVAFFPPNRRLKDLEVAGRIMRIPLCTVVALGLSGKVVLGPYRREFVTDVLAATSACTALISEQSQSEACTGNIQARK